MTPQQLAAIVALDPACESCGRRHPATLTHATARGPVRVVYQHHYSLVPGCSTLLAVTYWPNTPPTVAKI
jgi:hypothetical protein